jgi:SAM-dependent methyltransferase
MGWYKKSFGVEYLSVYRERNEEQASQEVDFILRELKPPMDAWILDLACGAGRHARALARRGLVNMVGVDLSRELLEVATKESTGGKAAPLLVRGDMRHIPFRACFDIVLSLFTSFGYFEDEMENARVASGMARVLAPGGRLVLDLPNRQYIEANLVPESTGRRNGDTIIERRRLRKNGGLRVEKHIVIKNEERDAVRREFFESVRLYSKEEIKYLLENAGMEIEKFHGGFDGSEFDGSSPRMLVFGRKRDEN